MHGIAASALMQRKPDILRFDRNDSVLFHFPSAGQ
jgi:hypothetical protein